jgi:short-subunit dehydrogenase
MLAANRGVLVNVSSIFGVVAIPSQAAYNASKMAVRGWTEALEWELYQRDTQVRCLLVMPGGVATNIARSARFFVDPEGGVDLATAMNRFDAVARTTPAAAAAAILQAVHRGDSRLLIGPDAKVLFWLQRCLPRHYFHVLNAFVATTKIVQPRIQSVLRWWRGEKAAVVVEKKGQ